MKDSYDETTLLGTWHAPDTASGYQATVTITFVEDYTLHYIFEQSGSSSTTQTTWQYERGILDETTSHGMCKGRIQFMNKDYFVITILDNGDDSYKGVKRHYRRVVGKTESKIEGKK